MDIEEHIQTSNNLWKTHSIIKYINENQRSYKKDKSKISLLIAPGEEIENVKKFMLKERTSAKDIKSTVHRTSVLASIDSTKKSLQAYSEVPQNGLVVFSGAAQRKKEETKGVKVLFEPHNPIAKTMYFRNNYFCTDILEKQLDVDLEFGFIIMDGNSTLFGILSGITRKILREIRSEVPSQKSRRGNSSNHVSKICTEIRHKHIKRICNLALDYLVKDNKCIVEGIVLAGSGGLKSELSKSNLFDCRLREKVVGVFNTDHGGKTGFYQAIKLSVNVITERKLLKEKRLLKSHHEESLKNSGKSCYGIVNTVNAFKSGLVAHLFIWRNLNHVRYVLNDNSNNKRTFDISKEQADELTSCSVEDFLEEYTDMELESTTSLVEWILENCKQFGTKVDMVTELSEEGLRFVKQYEGLGGILHYKNKYVNTHNLSTSL
ncbi:peptide chain release factor eRF1/aRF1 [Phycomyces nitens]|nr:peptide chain release factor eRF1/aRF1 [Phycomyces nitens]